MRTFRLSLLSFVLGLGIMMAIVFPFRFLWVAYQHGGLF